jgi:hypothetical protein
VSCVKILNVDDRNILLTSRSGHMYAFAATSQVHSFIDGNNAIVGKLFKKRAHGPYILAVVLLWMTCTSSFIFDWVRGRNAFVLNSSSPTDILISFEASSNVASFVLVLIGTIISDGILVYI